MLNSFYIIKSFFVRYFLCPLSQKTEAEIRCEVIKIHIGQYKL